jgi:hypothetical protein
MNYSVVDVPDVIRTDWAAVAKAIRELPDGKGLDIGASTQSLQSRSTNRLKAHGVNATTKTVNGRLFVWEMRGAE